MKARILRRNAVTNRIETLTGRLFYKSGRGPLMIRVWHPKLDIPFTRSAQSLGMKIPKDATDLSLLSKSVRVKCRVTDRNLHLLSLEN
jgi:hypothetical protein